MQPESIRRFTWYYLAALVVSQIGPALEFERMTAQIGRQTASLGYSLGPGAVVASIAVGIAITLLLWFFVARRGSSIAKWIVVLLFLFNLVTLFGGGGFGMAPSQLTALIAVALQALAVYYLFRPDAKAWFETGPAADDSAPAPPEA